MIATTGEFATCTASMAAFEFHTAAGELQKPLCFGIEMLPRVRANIKGTTTAGVMPHEILSNHIFANRRAAIPARANPKPRRGRNRGTGMTSMKNPESARCPNPQAACARRKRPMAKAAIQRRGFALDLNKASGRH